MVVDDYTLGNVTQHGYTACALFDSGATRSLVTAAFAQTYILLTKSLPQTVVFMIPDGSTITCIPKLLVTIL